MSLNVEQSASTKSTRSRWRWTGVSLALLLVVSWWAFSHRERAIDGKTPSEWFEDFHNWKSPSGLHTARCYQVFMELEGDAIPFLIQQTDAHLTAFDKGYTEVSSWLPSWITKKLPTPLDDGYYSSRRISALQLLGLIGSRQRHNSDAGKPTTKAPVSLAVSHVRKLLSDPVPSTRTFAAQALWFIGPAAADAVPDLIRLAANPAEQAANAAVQSFGTIGPPASNAVPLLIQIATNEGSRRQIQAVQSLGGMGGPAIPAVPVIASLLDTTNAALNLVAARALAELGVTPESAVPALMAMRRGTNAWAASVASLALWNRDHEDEELRAVIISALRSDQRGGMTSCLRSLGTNALSFAEELRRLLNDSNEVVRGQAKTTLRRVQPISP